MSAVNPKLGAALSENVIPSSVLSSYECTWRALAIIERNDEIQSIRTSISEGPHIEIKLKRIKDATNTALSTWNSLKATYIEETGPDPINNLIRDNRFIKAELKAYPENRDRRTKVRCIQIFSNSLQVTILFTGSH
jgi:hypothetical protein